MRLRTSRWILRFILLPFLLLVIGGIASALIACLRGETLKQRQPKAPIIIPFAYCRMIHPNFVLPETCFLTPIPRSPIT